MVIEQTKADTSALRSCAYNYFIHPLNAKVIGKDLDHGYNEGMLTASCSWIESECQGKAASFQSISNLHSIE